MSNPLNLFTGDGKRISACLCDSCHRIWESAESAERCCKCSYCGGSCDWRHGVSHRDCQDTARKKGESDRLEKAEVVEDYGGPFLYDDRFFRDADELIEYIEVNDQQIPEFVFAARYVKPELDLESILQELQENEMHEDWEPEACGALDAAVRAWNEANATNGSWWEDDTRKVRLPVSAHGAAQS